MKFIVSSLLLLNPFVFAVEDEDRRTPTSQVKQDPIYLKKRIQLGFIQGRIKAAKSEIKKLMLEKKTTQNPKKSHKIITQLVKLHANLKKEVKKYSDLKNQLKYRYPGKGYELDRKYMTLRKPSLNQIEDEIGLDAKLTRLKKKVDKKYEAFMDKDKLKSKKARNKVQKNLAQDQARRPASLQKKKKRLRLEK